MKDHTDNPKYQKILKTGRELFWRHGFRRVSVEEICREAGVSKMTYYKFFPNKIELAKTVFDQVLEEGAERFWQLMRDDIPGPERIRQIILLKIEGANNVSHEFLKDFYSSPELGLNAYVEERTKTMWENVLQEFKEAQRKGWFRDDLRPEFLWYMSQKVAGMLNDEELLKQYESPQDLILEVTKFFAYGISPRK